MLNCAVMNERMKKRKTIIRTSPTWAMHGLMMQRSKRWVKESGQYFRNIWKKIFKQNHFINIQKTIKKKIISETSEKQFLNKVDNISETSGKQFLNKTISIKYELSIENIFEPIDYRHFKMYLWLFSLNTLPAALAFFFFKESNELNN